MSEEKAAQLTHYGAVEQAVNIIIGPPNDSLNISASRNKLREALLAITVPPDLVMELAGDLRAIGTSLQRGGARQAPLSSNPITTPLAHDHVPLEQQVAAWQAMALRISEEKAAIEKRLRTLAEDWVKAHRLEDELARGPAGDEVIDRIVLLLGSYLPDEGSV